MQEEENVIMLSLLIISENPQASKQYAEDFSKQHTIDPLDITTIANEEENIGVESIRELQKKMYLKPLRGPTKAIIITNAHTATPEAQNALLKVLEEPPANTQMILTAIHLRSFLPTILSRCKVLMLDQKPKELSAEEQKKYCEEYAEILQSGISSRLARAQQVTADKNYALVWTKNMISSLSMLLLEKRDPNLARELSLFQEVYTKLTSTNINSRFLMENFFLNLPITKKAA